MTDPERSEISEVREVVWPSIPPSHRVPRRPPAAVTGARGGRLKPDAREARASAPAVVVVDRAVGGRVEEEGGSRRERGREGGREVVIVVLVERGREGGSAAAANGLNRGAWSRRSAVGWRRHCTAVFTCPCTFNTRGKEPACPTNRSTDTALAVTSPLFTFTPLPSDSPASDSGHAQFPL